MKTIANTAAALGALALLAGPVTASADHSNSMRAYDITITNITKGQVFSPPVLALHKDSVAIFEAGAAASPELVSVAEDGDGTSLAALLNSLPQVGVAQANMMPIPPGASATYRLSARRSFNVVSVVGMLVNTNDAFFAIDSRKLPKSRGWTKRMNAPAYDAGSEDNNEDCAFIPGPACPAGSGNARDIDGAEGYVHIHNGVHDIGDLSPAAYDWRNPVARVTVKRVR